MRLNRKETACSRKTFINLIKGLEQWRMNHDIEIQPKHNAILIDSFIVLCYQQCIEKK